MRIFQKEICDYIERERPLFFFIFTQWFLSNQTKNEDTQLVIEINSLIKMFTMIYQARDL